MARRGIVYVNVIVLLTVALLVIWNWKSRPPLSVAIDLDATTEAARTASRESGDQRQLISLVRIASSAQERAEADRAAKEVPTLPRYLPSGAEVERAARFNAANAKYLTEILVPRARECWRTIKGDGKIKLRHTFIIEDGHAVAKSKDFDTDESITIMNSTLPESEDERALGCMLEAAEGTSFQYVSLFAEPSKGLVIYQTWDTVERQQRLQRER